MKLCRTFLVAILCSVSALAASAVSVSISTPANNATVSSPLTIAASATSGHNITGWKIYVDGTAVYSAGAVKSIKTSLPLSTGKHTILVRAWIKNGYGSATLTETVESQTAGQAQGKLSTSSLAFGSVAQNTTSPAQNLVITNTGSTQLNITGISVSSPQFAVTGPTSTSIAPGSSYTYSVTFKPTAAASYSGNLTFSSNSATAIPTVALSGTGVAAAVTPLVLTTSSLPSGVTGTAYNATMSASGGTAPYTWSIVSGQPSTGLSLSPSGVISGTPTASGTSTFSVQVKDSASSPQVATSTFSIVVAASTASTCVGTCYYVSPTGSDSNTGTSPSTPWKTLAQVQRFQANLQPGDSVLLQSGGVWYEQLNITNMNGGNGYPITIGSYGAGNKPVIDGGQTSTAPGRDYCINAINTTYKWITVDGLECRNAYRQGMTFQAFNGTGTNGVGVVVQNSYIHHDGPGACTGCGTTPSPDPGGYLNQLDAQVTTGVKFLNNTLDHLGGHNAVNVAYDTGGPVVSGNRVGTNAPYCNHNCIDLKGPVGAQVTSNVVTCPKCGSATAAFYTENTGYRLPTSETMTYVGNVVNQVPVAFQAETGGTCLNSPCSMALKYYNNTIYQPNSSWFNFMDTSCTNHSLDVQKNIVDGGVFDIHSNCSLKWDYNDNGGVYPGVGNPAGAHDLSRVNPQYVDTSAGNFSPQNTTILSYGANDPVTTFVYLGAKQ